MLKRKNKKNDQAELREYYLLVKPILLHPEFQKRKNMLHHQDSVYMHCLRVSLCGFRIAKKLKPFFPELSIRDVALAGLLHDFYTNPWRCKSTDRRFFHQHGFVHSYEAAKNAYIHFPELMDPFIEDAIVKHMFPLNRKLPKYGESWIITIADKIISMEIFAEVKELPRYIGIKRKKA